ncbi:Sterol-4-alpha-carboxylate 3-dehydrogenase, decarboxylating [Lecanosticta acicola]|uniref:Sterol-4-alpha-carboxylate 3-dehydrogenase, decarboxylating n=1 Tax=Lecanosticta acicola TaxID=111012 RepID=A0AAI9E4Y6_9PEZI|nr:Sterol-4-alpha-carboxylate 3-dehydrogenase, decarboxylating [Lecanosticta acicola]
MEQSAVLHVLVTGGSGFLGRGIVKALLEGHPTWKITILDLHAPDPETQGRIAGFVEADITSPASVSDAFVNYKPDIVVHTAGIVPARDYRYSTDSKQWDKVKAINYHGTANVLEATMASGCRRFVYTSSCTAVIDDLDHDYYNMDESVPLGYATLHYGKSKGMAEQYVLSNAHAEKGLKACALRPCTILGPGDTAVIGLMYDLIAKYETYFIVGDGDNIYDFMYIDNAVRAHVLAVENLLTTATAAGHAFFISNQEPVYFWDFLAYVWAQFGHVPAFRIHIPMWLAWVVALILEVITFFTGSASTLDRGSVKDGVRTQYSNNAKARRILGYVPEVKLAEGVRRSCDDYQRYLASKRGDVRNLQAAKSG